MIVKKGIDYDLWIKRIILTGVAVWAVIVWLNATPM